MKARVKGEVFRSIQQAGKKNYTTAITQSETETQTIKVSTLKQYKPGDQIDLNCRISVSLFNGKAYLIIQEIDEQGEQAKKAVKI